MVKTQEDYTEERRKNILGPLDVGSYSPGIERLEKNAKEKLKEHDVTWLAADPKHFLTNYSLLEHSVQLARVMEKIGKARGRSNRLVYVGEVSALFHDMGKLDKNCDVYRLNRKLTNEEYGQINTHASLSGNYILEKMVEVRAPDRAFLIDVYYPVLYHHIPWQIKNPELREIGFDLNQADVFVSLMENRHRPGLSQFIAVEALEEIIIKEESSWRNSGYWLEVQATFQTIARLFGRPYST